MHSAMMKPAAPKHLFMCRKWFWLIKSAPHARNRMLALASMKSWPNMQNKSIRIAEIKASIHIWSKWLWGYVPVCSGCAWSSRWAPRSATTLGRRKLASIRRVGEKKTHSLGQEGEWGLIQALKRGFRGVFCSLCLGLIFWCVEILQKSYILEHAGREAEMRQIGRWKAEFLRETHPKGREGHMWCIVCSFSVWTSVMCKKFLLFLIVDCFWVCWSEFEPAKTQAVRTQNASLTVLCWRFPCRSFCFNGCDLHIRGQRDWVLWIDAMNWSETAWIWFRNLSVQHAFEFYSIWSIFFITCMPGEASAEAEFRVFHTYTHA